MAKVSHGNFQPSDTEKISSCVNRCISSRKDGVNPVRTMAGPKIKWVLRGIKCTTLKKRQLIPRSISHKEQISRETERGRDRQQKESRLI